MSRISCRSMKDVVDFAIDRETRARDFYLQCKEDIVHKGLKKLFQELADEEERHKQLLEELDMSRAEAFEPAEVEDMHLSDFMVDVSFKPNMSYQEALLMAIKKEEKAHAFYAAWQNRCGSEQSARVFDFLAEEELKHKRKLEEIYDTDILQAD